MKAMKPNKAFAPYEKLGQRNEIFHVFFIGKGETRDTGHKWRQGTQMDTGDTRDTRRHKGQKGQRGHNGHRGHETQGDTRDTGQTGGHKGTQDKRDKYSV